VRICILPAVPCRLGAALSVIFDVVLAERFVFMVHSQWAVDPPACCSLQVDLLAQHHEVVPAVELPESFQSQAQVHWYQTQRPFNTTQLVQDLCLTLEMLRIPYQKGISASTGLLLIDVALTDRQASADFKHLLCGVLYQIHC